VPTQEKVSFVGSAGAELSGVLHSPDEGAKGSVLLAHCFTCSKDLHTMTRLARGLSDAGYAVFRFDFTGLGQSGGEFGDTTVSTNVGDLSRAALTLIQMGFGPCGMVGHSLGGAAALLAAQRVKTVESLAVVGAPASPQHVRRLLKGSESEIEDKGEAIVEIGGRKFPISLEFLQDLDEHMADKAVEELGRPLLIIHAVDDEVVGVEEGERIFSRAKQPKSFVPLLGADHLLSDPGSAAEAAATLTEWFNRTLHAGHDGDHR
jgi:putative redox protein